MADKYLGFTYNGIHSFNDYITSGFKAYILNDGEDLKFFNTPAFSNEYAFPKFGESSVLLGINKENRILNYRILVKEVTLSNYRKFLSWLKLDGITKSLFFDYDTNFAYNVIVESIGEGLFTVNKDCDMSNPTYNVELEVSFSTVGDYAAMYRHSTLITIGSFTNTLFTIGPNLASVYYNTSNNNLTITNNTNEKMFFEINLGYGYLSQESTPGNFRIDDFTFFNDATSNEIIYYSKYGIILNNSSNFVPTIENSPLAHLIEILPNSTKTIIFTYQNISISVLYFKPIIREVV